MSNEFSSTEKHRNRGAWSAVLSMSFCVALLIAAEFMPVSLLPPIAKGLGASVGQTGEAISISGFFAMISALLTSTAAGKINRRSVLLLLTVCMIASLVIVAIASNFPVFMLGRALLGICIGGFWSLATSIIMRLVPSEEVSKALGIMYLGQAIASAFAAPMGSFLGGILGWRAVFWIMAPMIVINLVWQWQVLPSLPSKEKIRVTTLTNMLKRRYFLSGLISMAFTWGGAFTMFTYLRPYLEQRIGLNTDQISLMFLALGCAGFIGSPLGSKMTDRHLLALLKLVPMVMSIVTLLLLWSAIPTVLVAIMLAIWGAMNTALSIGWMGWMSKNVEDQPETAGSLMVATIQGAILLGSFVGGVLLTLGGITATFIGSIVLLMMALFVMGTGKRLLNPSLLDSSIR